MNSSSKKVERKMMTYGNPPREGPKPFAVRPSTKLGQRLSKTWQSFKHPKNSSIPSKPDRAHICTIKSHIPNANALARVKIPNKQAGDNIAQESQKRLKRGRPIGSKDKNPHKRKGTEKNFDHEENVLNETQDMKTLSEEEMNDMNKEMSINYSQTNILWDRNELGDIDEIFSYSVASDIMGGDDDPEPKSTIDCQIRPDWDKWKDAMQAELNSLNKRNLFRPIVTIPRDVKLVGCI
ncbi:hypothetical protein Tco_0247659 [Tanacetum coccineum]